MGLAAVLIFGMLCVGLAAGWLLFSSAQHHRKHWGRMVEAAVLYILAGGCAVFSAYMGWMLLDILHYAGL